MVRNVGALIMCIGLVACSSTPTYQVPDYYETRVVPEQLSPGQVRDITSLRCSQRPDRCDPKAYEERRQLNQHRSYPKAYLFE